MNKYLKYIIIAAIYAVLSVIVFVGSALILEPSFWLNVIGVLLFSLGSFGYWIKEKIELDKWI